VVIAALAPPAFVRYRVSRGDARPESEISEHTADDDKV
jgi:hypothetical protein